MILHHSKVTSCLHSLPLCSVVDGVFVDAANDMFVDKKADSDAVFSRKQTNNKPRDYYINANKTVTGNCSDHLETVNALGLLSWCVDLVQCSRAHVILTL